MLSSMPCFSSRAVSAGMVQTGCRGKLTAFQPVHQPQPDASRVHIGRKHGQCPMQERTQVLNAAVQSNTSSPPEVIHEHHHHAQLVGKADKHGQPCGVQGHTVGFLCKDLHQLAGPAAQQADHLGRKPASQAIRWQLCSSTKQWVWTEISRCLMPGMRNQTHQQRHGARKQCVTGQTSDLAVQTAAFALPAVSHAGHSAVPTCPDSSTGAHCGQARLTQSAACGCSSQCR